MYGAEGPSNPIDGSVLTNDAALRVHVVHILRPVFNRRISQSGFIANKSSTQPACRLATLYFGALQPSMK